MNQNNNNPPPPDSTTATVPLTSTPSTILPILNKLQDILSPLSSTQFNLPQVAVIGSQSSGKSSVLESLVGRDFLPRGNNICTRRPLILQLVRTPNQITEYGEFGHLPGKIFNDFNEIRKRIEFETDEEAGRDKGVSGKEIRLRICSPNVVDITLVDLPGVTKVPVGDQPGDIERMVKDLIFRYIRMDNCVILAVSQANSDLATSDALQIAREVDPKGLRTLGVITKLDLMDRGTDACKFLLGEVIPLRLGYVGVVNRAQEDIIKNRSIVHAFEKEEKFFLDNPVYTGVSDCCGIRNLAKKLNQILEQHIRAVLPNLKAELNSRLVAVVKELQSYGYVMESKGEQGAVLSSILTKYCEAFSYMVDGKSQEFSTKELSGGARIKYIFQSSFVKRLEDVNPCENMTDEDIRVAIQNATGLRNSLFVPEAPFENLVRRQIARLLEPSLQCLDFIHDELITIGYTCEPIEMQRFPVLRRHLGNILKKFLCEGVKAADRMIKNIIDMELSYINSSHPSFIGGKNAVEKALQQGRVSQTNSISSSHPNIIGEKSGIGLEQLSKLEFSGKTEESLIKPDAIEILQNQMEAQQSYSYKAATKTAGYLTSKIRGVSSVFGSRRQSADGSCYETSGQTLGAERIKQNSEAAESIIHLDKPSFALRLPERQTNDETVEILVTKLLVSSYYDIVRKNVQDLVPKAIMHFLINYTKSNLLGTLMQRLFRENLFEEMLKEEDDIAKRRKETNKLFHVLQQAVQTLDDVVGDVCFRKSNSELDASNTLLRLPVPRSSLQFSSDVWMSAEE